MYIKLSDLIKIGIKNLNIDSTVYLLFNDGTEIWMKSSSFNNDDFSDTTDFFVCKKDKEYFDVINDINTIIPFMPSKSCSLVNCSVEDANKIIENTKRYEELKNIKRAINSFIIKNNIPAKVYLKQKDYDFELKINKESKIDLSFLNNYNATFKITKTKKFSIL